MKRALLLTLCCILLLAVAMPVGAYTEVPFWYSTTLPLVGWKTIASGTKSVSANAYMYNDVDDSDVEYTGFAQVQVGGTWSAVTAEQIYYPNTTYRTYYQANPTAGTSVRLRAEGIGLLSQTVCGWIDFG